MGNNGRAARSMSPEAAGCRLLGQTVEANQRANATATAAMYGRAHSLAASAG